MGRFSKAKKLGEILHSADCLCVAGHSAWADHPEIDVGGHAAGAAVLRCERIVAMRRVRAQAAAAHVGGPAGDCGAWTSRSVAQPADSSVALAWRGEEGILIR